VALLHVMHVLFNLRTGGLEMQVVNVINHSGCARFRRSVCCLGPEGREYSLEAAVRRHEAMYEGRRSAEEGVI